MIDKVLLMRKMTVVRIVMVKMMMIVIVRVVMVVIMMILKAVLRMTVTMMMFCRENNDGACLDDQDTLIFINSLNV